jgi:hypothetical protein
MQSRCVFLKNFMNYNVKTIMKRKSQDNKILIYIFFLNIITRIIYFFLVFDEESFNRWMPEQFDRRALLLINGGQHYYPTAWASYYVPLAGIYKILDILSLLDQRLIVVGVISCILGALSVLYLYKIAKEIFSKLKLLPVLIAVLFSLYYPYLYFNAVNVSENIFTPIAIILFYFALKCKKKFFIVASITGLLTGLALIMRPVILPFLPFFFIFIYKQFKKGFSKFILQFLFPFFFCIALIIVPTLLINRSIDSHGNYSITGNGGVNFTIAWCEPKKIRYQTESGESFWFASPTLRGRPDSSNINTDVPFYEQNYYYKLGFDCLKDNPKQLATNLKHIFYTFHSSFYPDFDPFPFHTNLINIWKVLTIPLILGFFIFPFVWKKKFKLWLPGAALIFPFVISIYSQSIGEERYIVPYYFVFIIYGIGSFGGLLSKFIKYEKSAKVAMSKKILIFLIALPAVIAILTILAFLMGKLVNN